MVLFCSRAVVWTAGVFNSQRKGFYATRKGGPCVLVGFIGGCQMSDASNGSYASAVC